MEAAAVYNVITESHEPMQHQNGRSVPPLSEVTLPDSGYTVQIRPIGPLTMQELGKQVRKGMPMPMPPLNVVLGLSGTEREEPNPADADYIQEVADWEARVAEEVGARLFKLIARRGIASPVDSDAVARVREDFEAIGLVAPEDDQDVFLNHVLIASAADLTALQNAIMRRSQPTEEAVQEKVAEFPGDVQGA